VCGIALLRRVRSALRLIEVDLLRCRSLWQVSRARGRRFGHRRMIVWLLKLKPVSIFRFPWKASESCSDLASSSLGLPLELPLPSARTQATPSRTLPAALTTAEIAFPSIRMRCAPLPDV
jgi:hypothetical protein